MTEEITTFLTSSLSVIIASIVAYFVSIRTTRKKVHHEIITEQKYKYFLPFKYQAEEFLHRVQHIERRLSQDQPEMKAHFSTSYDGKELGWYFTDWIDIDKLETGGYFLTSTLYFNCLLYHRMKVMQEKFPYILTKLNESLEKKSRSTDRKIKDYFEQLEKDKSVHASHDHKEWLKYQGKLDIAEIVSAIRVATIMRRGQGIPFALHPSFGDFISHEDGVMNYEEFCQQLKDENQRIKFSPLIDFWTTVVDQDRKVNQEKLNKLRNLVLALKLVELIELG